MQSAGNPNSNGLPSLRPLDYSLLSSREAVQDELEAKLLELGKWLSLVSDGLDKVVQGQVNIGVELGSKAQDGYEGAPGREERPNGPLLQVSV